MDEDSPEMLIYFELRTSTISYVIPHTVEGNLFVVPQRRGVHSSPWPVHLRSLCTASGVKQRAQHDMLRLTRHEFMVT